MLVVALLAEWVVYGVGRARSTGSNNVGGQPVKSLDFTLGTAVGTVCVNIVTISFAYAWVDALAAWVSPTEACPWRGLNSSHGVNV